MFKNIHVKLVFIAAIAIFISCEKDDPKPVNEEEVFTRVDLKVTNQADNATETISFEVDHDHNHAISTREDDDHDHGDHKVVELESDSTYKFEITFWNEEENVTAEIIEEADEHQVFYELAAGSGITVTAAADDTKDSGNNPVHLKTLWKTTTAGEVDVEAYLIHDPTSKTGTVRADFGGSTDVEIEFEAHVE
jgi:hypothetical protein